MQNRNLVKRLFITLLVLFIGAIIIAFSLVYLYEDKIKAYSIQHINKAINARIDVEKIDLSFFSQFPKASLDFHNVEFYDNNPKKKADFPIIKSEHIFLSFDVLELLSDNYNLQEIVINNAIINLEIYKNGKNNFSFLSSSKDSDSSSFLINLNSVSFVNTEFNYDNKVTRQKVKILIKNSTAKGIFSEKNFEIDLKGKTILKYFYNKSRLIALNKRLDLDVITKFNIEKEYYSLKKGLLTYHGIPMKLSGGIQMYKYSIGINAKLSAINLRYKDIAKNIDKEFLANIKKYNFQGLINLDVEIGGKIGGKHKPHVSAIASISKFKFDIDELKLSAKDVSLEAKYNNGKNNTLNSSSIVISNLRANSNIGHIEGEIEIRNLWQPKLKAEFRGDLDLEPLNDVLSVDTIVSMAGKASTYTWLSMNFKYSKDNDEWKVEDINFDNNFDIQNASLTLKDSKLSYSSVNTKGRIENNKIIIYQLTAFAQGSKISALGSLYNLPYSSKYIKARPTVANFSLKVDNLSYDKIIGALPKGGDDDDSRFSNKLDIVIDVETEKFVYDNINVTDLSGRFQMRNRRLSFFNIKANTLGGSLGGMLWIDGSKRGVYNLFLEGETKGLDIMKSFKIFNNFGQETITSKNISGDLDSKYELKCSFDSSWKIYNSSIELNTNMVVKNGILKDVESLNAIKSYTKIDDFSELKFSELKNNISVANSQILIPEMRINSNKMNIDVSGIHKFDNSYEYHFTILLSEVLGKKYESTSSEFGEVENDGYGRTKLFLTLIGKDDKFEVEYDKSGLRKKMKNDLQDEKQSLKKALNSEFGWFKTEEDKVKKDSVKTPKQKKNNEKEKIKKQEEGEFIIEWDDE